MTKQAITTVVADTTAMPISTMTHDSLRRQAVAAQAAKRAAAIANTGAGIAAGQAEVAALLGMGAFSAASAPAARTARAGRKATLFHASHPDKCRGIDRASIPSFKKGGAELEKFVIAEVGTVAKAAGETFERIEAIRKCCGGTLAQYAATGGDRNWLGYFADRGKVVITLAA